MAEIETAAWVETRTRWDRHDGEEIAMSTPHWLRMNPPAEAWHIDFEDSWSHDVADERGRYHTASTWDKCHFYPHNRPYAPDHLLTKVFFPPAPEASSPTQCSRLEWQHEQVEQEGKSLLRWYCDYVQDNFHVTQSIWAEPESRRIVRKERHETDLQTGEPAAIIVCDQYLYNGEPPAGTFEMPAGKPIVTPDYGNTMPEVWDTFSTKEQAAIQEIINRSDAGWRNADFSPFASVWEFDFVSLVPREAEWRERVQQQAGLWNRWISVVESANTQRFIPVTIAVTTFRWGPERYKVLRVKVKLKVAQEEGASEWEGHAEFYLRRKGRGYRIVHWECPWEEIKARQSRKT